MNTDPSSTADLSLVRWLPLIVCAVGLVSAWAQKYFEHRKERDNVKRMYWYAGAEMLRYLDAIKEVEDDADIDGGAFMCLRISHMNIDLWDANLGKVYLLDSDLVDMITHYHWWVHDLKRNAEEHASCLGSDAFEADDGLRLLTEQSNALRENLRTFLWAADSTKAAKEEIPKPTDDPS